MLRLFHHYFSGKKLALFLAESVAAGTLCVVGALAVSTVMAPQSAMRPALSAPVLVLALMLVAIFQFSLYAVDLYNLQVAGEDRARGGRVLRAAGMAAVAVGGIAAIVAELVRPVLPAGALLGGALGAFAGAMLVRSAFRAVVGHPKRVLVVGNGVKAVAVSRLVELEGEDAFTICGMVEPFREGTEGRNDEEPIDHIAQRARADIVVVACDEARGAIKADRLLQCRFQGIRVYEAAGFCERVLRRLPVAHLRPSELAYADEIAVSPLRRYLKRGFDVVVASALLLCALPVMALVAMAIKLDSRGPVFYRQERTGIDGKSFWLWKFRSMRTDAEKDGAVWARQDDDRVTRVGRFIRKTRMDEIPQVLNVLLGDMSFVGPRPERPVFVQQLAEQIPFFALRHLVKPGITGWAQIRYPYGASVDDARNKLEYDLYYIKNGSLMLDLAIIFHTVRHVLMGRGAR